MLILCFSGLLGVGYVPVVFINVLHVLTWQMNYCRVPLVPPADMTSSQETLS